MANLNETRRNNSSGRLGGWGIPLAGVLAIALALAGISVSRAEPTDAGQEFCATDVCSDSHQGRWGLHRRGHRLFGHRGHDPEAAKEHMQYATGWMLRRLDVAEDMRDQIQDRLDIAFDALLPLIETHKDTQGIWLEAVLGAEAVDRDELEAQRRSAMVSADRASEIIAAAVADVAEMLTPEQRAELAERIQRHHR